MHMDLKGTPTEQRGCKPLAPNPSKHTKHQRAQNDTNATTRDANLLNLNTQEARKNAKGHHEQQGMLSPSSQTLKVPTNAQGHQRNNKECSPLPPKSCKHNMDLQKATPMEQQAMRNPSFQTPIPNKQAPRNAKGHQRNSKDKGSDVSVHRPGPIKGCKS